MILQELKEYYDRKLQEGTIAKDGWIKGELDFLIDLDLDGNIIGISDLREGHDKKELDLPNIGKQAVRHPNSGKDANLLWDNSLFVFGLDEKGKIEKGKLRLKSMIEAIDTWIGETDDLGVKAVRKFLTKGLENRDHFKLALTHPEYGEIFKSGRVKISFRVPQSGLPIVFNSPVVIDKLNQIFDFGKKPSKQVRGTCLVTGIENAVIELTHPPVKGVRGCQSSGGSIVSFNKPSFNSYNKTQSQNAPVSKSAASQYTKALETLLSSSRQCINIGDSTIIFWSKKTSSFESDFAFFFENPQEDDSPDAGTHKIKALYDSVYTGAYKDDDGKTPFYILGLAPNSGRIAIRFWETGTISEIASRIKQYFDDFSIIKPPDEMEYYPVWMILENIATKNEKKNIPANLVGDFIRSILKGTEYPAAMFQLAIRRIRSDPKDRVKPIRAAIIKAYLNRYNKNKNVREVSKELDTYNTSTSYQLGRLFAVLEKIQEKANPKINTTIRQRFYASASSTPQSVFPNLLRLKNYHLAKLNRANAVYFEHLLGQIFEQLSEFPAYLTLHEQGLFAIGYYHQQQAFFKGKNN